MGNQGRKKYDSFTIPSKSISKQKSMLSGKKDEEVNELLRVDQQQIGTNIANVCVKLEENVVGRSRLTLNVFCEFVIRYGFPKAESSALRISSNTFLTYG